MHKKLFFKALITSSQLCFAMKDWLRKLDFGWERRRSVDLKDNELFNSSVLIYLESKLLKTFYDFSCLQLLIGCTCSSINV